MNEFAPSPFATRPATSINMSVAASALEDFAFAAAAEHDYDGAFPHQEVRELHRLGLLTAPLDRDLGGVSPDPGELAVWLRRVGAGSLPLGRLYEGHVNALGLIARYGHQTQARRAADEARSGRLFGVWNTDDADGVRLTWDTGRLRLQGRKILASGAGEILRPLITATDGDGRRLMVTPLVSDPERSDLTSWTAQGMRASATGAVDFSGIVVEDQDIVGEAGDYERQPNFSGGAWRFCAVQQGAMETLLRLLRDHLNKSGRGGDPHQAARVGQAAIAVETARLWVEQAARMAEDRDASKAPERVVAYVNLTRLAVERAALDLIEIVQRSIGLQGFIRPQPVERMCRDLATYLRQPAPDRALTNAAAWVLGAEADIRNLWTS